MNLEQGLLIWLEDNTALRAWWFERPNNDNRAIVFRNISPGSVSGNLADPSLRRDLFSITVYHENPESGKTIADTLIGRLHRFSGDLGGKFVQFIEFENGFDRKLNAESGQPIYQFNRDFMITY